MDSKSSFDAYRMPDAIWEKIQPLLPAYKTSSFEGRPRRDLRSIADAIFYRLRTGCRWNAIPACLAPGSTAHAYFQEWVELGIFATLLEIALELYDDLGGSRLALAERGRRDDESTTWRRIDGKKPNRSCKIGNQVIVDHRGRRNSNWPIGGRCQCA
jgi:putative transposase